MNLIFILLALLTLVSGLAAVTLRSTVHCALALAATFAGLAMLFLQLDAQFAGFAQILVYIGAVAILVVFAILLTRNADEATNASVLSKNWPIGLVIAGLVFAVLGAAIGDSVQKLPHETAAPAVTVQQIGEALMGRYVLPLEIVALLLTAALIGAVIVAMQEKEGAK